MPPQVFSPACLGLIWGTPVLGTHQAVLVVWSGFVHIPPSTPMLWVAPGNSCISTRWSQWGLGSDTVCTCLFSLASVHPALENSGDGIHLVQLVARGPPYFHIVPWCPGELSWWYQYAVSCTLPMNVRIEHKQWHGPTLLIPDCLKWLSCQTMDG